MDDALTVVVAMNRIVWGGLKGALKDLSEDEIEWRPLPQANNINVIVRHLRIEAEWHLASLEHGEPMPTIAVAPSQEAIDAVPMDFEANFRKLEEFYARFLELLADSTLVTLKQRTAAFGVRRLAAAFSAAACRGSKLPHRKRRQGAALQNPTYPKQP